MHNPKSSLNQKIEINCNNDEHQSWNRRSFIKALGLAGGGSMMLGSTSITASSLSPLATAISQSKSDQILVLIRLKGGNDGLNTIVPIFDYDVYANLRPTLKHNLSNLVKLSPDFGIPNFMAPIEHLWKNGAMKVVHGVGYDNGSLSHFRGSDIWASAHVNDDINQTGCLGRYFQELYPDYTVNPPEMPAAIQIGSIGNLIFDGIDNNFAFSVTNTEQLEQIAENGELYDLNDLPDCTYGQQLGFLRGTLNVTTSYAGVISEAYNRAENSVAYSENSISRQLANIARMIKGNLGTKVYMVTLGGFDTHANQGVRHEELLSNMSDAVKLFFDDLSASGLDKKVLAMTFSEFGRRPEENGSKGTDHGAAAPLMLFGPALDGNGFLGKHPSLTTLNEDGNIIYNIDFRQVYASILQEWLCIPASIVNQTLLGRKFNKLDLGFSCLTGSTSSDYNGLNHIIVYKYGRTVLRISIRSAAIHIVVKLYDILGREVAILKNEMLFTGIYDIDIREESTTNLSPGQYIYRIATSDKNYSASVIVR